MDYTAVGQTTHLAARMEQMAMAGSTLLTAEALRLAEGHVQVKPLGRVEVKGLKDPVEVYELTGAGAARTRLQASAARGLTRFVGREPEIAQLTQALERARAGHGQVLAVVGEPGVGKSRLLWEVTHSHRTQGWLVVESGSVSYGKATTYLPLIDLLKAYFQLQDRDDARTIREKVSGKLLTLDEVLLPALPAVLALLDVPVEDRAWQALDPPQRRQKTLEAGKRLLLRESQVQPLLLVFEDLHWIDAETQAFLDGLVDSLPTACLLLLVNYRPEYQHAWGGRTYYTQVRIDPLPPASAGELLQALLGTHGQLEPLTQLLIERTEGNPFFLEESVRTLIETRVLAGERGAYRLATSLTDIQVPPTVQAMLAARIDRLLPDDKRLLQSAAVIGKDVPFALLAAIADEPEDAVRRGLAHLQAAELLYEVSRFPDVAYTFKHALTHEVTYRGVLKERRRDLHARTVDAVEALYADLLTEHVERLVDHAMRGEVWEKVVAYATRAGTRAADRSASAQAKAYFNTALDALGRVPERRETMEQAIELRCLLTASYFVLGEREAYLSCMDEALALAERLGDKERLARVLAVRTNALWFAGHNARALEAGARAVTLADTVGHRIDQIHASVNLGLACATVGEHHRAVALFTRALDLLRDDLEGERLGRTLYPSVLARNELAASNAELGQFESAMRISEQALRIAEGLGHLSTLLMAGMESCEVLLRRGRFADAIPRLEVGLQAFGEAGLLTWSTSAKALLGYSYAMTGRLRDGVPLLREAVEQTAQGRRTREAFFAAYLCEAHLKDGQMAEARDLGARALDLSRQHGERGTEARILFVLGEIESHGNARGEGTTAERHYVAALALAEELGMRPIIARCHLGLGKLFRQTGEPLCAQEALTIAITMLREMDMRFWLEQAGAELKNLA
jgi:tetratricopeptide (TPR) repeat protein